MPLLHLLILALIQGVTEFLPVSSSGHLILLPKLTGLPDQGQALDVAVHVGTLGAVIFYFRADVKEAISGTLRLATGRMDTQGARLAFLLLIATIPVVCAGFLLKILGLTDALRSTAVIGWSMLIFGLVLYWADTSPQSKQESDWRFKDALLMGLAQAIALIPGTSRSGITITAARFLGYTRKDGAKLAMLMSIPTILASGTLLGLEMSVKIDAAIIKDILIGAAFAFLFALCALTLMMKLLKTVSFTPYVIYRIVLGVVLLVVAYT
jgi:undecaprenyl-diphosphatase